MRLKLCLLLGSAAMAMAATAQAQDEGPFQSREHSLTERLNRQQLAIHTMRASWQRRWYWAWDPYEYRWVPRYEERWAPRHSGYRNASFERARVVPIARPAQPDLPQARDAALANPAAKNETVASREEPKGLRADTDNKTKAADDHGVAVAGRNAKSETVASREEPKNLRADIDNKTKAADDHGAAVSGHGGKTETVASLEEPKGPRADTDNKSKAADDHGAAVSGHTAKTETVASLEESKSSPADLASKPASKDAAPEAKTATVDAKPLTPTEIRGAVPLEKVSDPKQALASAEIRSLWGDTIGKVHGVDLDNGAVKTVDADLAGEKHMVKMNASQLKYVKSRNVVLTPMSKADAEKLPKADNS